MFAATEKWLASTVLKPMANLPKDEEEFNPVTATVESLYNKFTIRLQILIVSLNKNINSFPQEAIQYLRNIVDGRIKPEIGFWSEFERKILFKKAPNGTLEFAIAGPGQIDRKKQEALIVMSFFLGKILASRLTIAKKAP